MASADRAVAARDCPLRAGGAGRRAREPRNCAGAGGLSGRRLGLAMAMTDAKAAGAALLGFWGALCRESADCRGCPP
jgi:hypothetical protein